MSPTQVKSNSWPFAVAILHGLAPAGDVGRLLTNIQINHKTEASNSHIVKGRTKWPFFPEHVNAVQSDQLECLTKAFGTQLFEQFLEASSSLGFALLRHAHASDGHVL